ncbi:MAG TPA: N-acetylmuramoyl-L-alanine amidase [Mycobacteriales bacterium]|nr:N-acetylmuramoyl-L-alanine amidase [Mycobacteriales bacterium]
MPFYRLGSRDPAVAQVRRWLADLGQLTPHIGEAPTAFTPAVDHAVRAFQQRRGLRVDGVVGPDTYRTLEGARWQLGDRTLHHHISHPYAGDDVLALQQRLSDLGFDVGRFDGHFGARTDTALRDFQRNYGLAPDGTVGPATLRALHQLSRSVTGGRSQELREAEALRGRGPRLAGKKVVVDPGHGGVETGWAAGGLTERDVVDDLGRRLQGRLAASGVEAFLTHGADSAPTDVERATFANETDADLLLSLHVDGSHSPRANGVATFYYGTGPRTGSVPGERLAELVQREIVARTDLLDGRCHPRTWELLRRTRMPAVVVEIGYLTHPGDARRLADPQLRDTVAEALLVAVQRLFLPIELDPPTGVLQLAALAGHG